MDMFCGSAAIVGVTVSNCKCYTIYDTQYTIHFTRREVTAAFNYNHC